MYISKQQKLKNIYYEIQKNNSDVDREKGRVLLGAQLDYFPPTRSFRWSVRSAWWFNWKQQSLLACILFSYTGRAAYTPIISFLLYCLFNPFGPLLQSSPLPPLFYFFPSPFYPPIRHPIVISSFLPFSNNISPLSLSLSHFYIYRRFPSYTSPIFLPHPISD